MPSAGTLRSKAGSLLGKLGRVVAGQTAKNEREPDYEPDHALVTYNRDVAISLLEQYGSDYRYEAKALKITAAALPRISVERFSPYAAKRREMQKALQEELDKAPLEA